jgi:hypothetical protein
MLALFELLWANPDSALRAVYINPYKASKKAYLEEIYKKADSGLITAIVVDFKSDYGFLAYPSSNAIAKKTGAVKRYIDVKDLIRKSREHNIKLIARIVCFRDDYLAYYSDYGIRNDSDSVWEDKKGLAWTNPYQKSVRNYLYDITEEIVDLGVTSIAFDYIRFPTDGDIQRIRLAGVNGPREKPLLAFLKKVKDNLGDRTEIGICVFGFAVWYALIREGQDIEKMGEYVDVIYPMLYPSHFGWGFKRDMDEYWRNYWIYYDSVIEAMEKLPTGVKIVPFVQGFDYLAKSFDNQYVYAQINGALSANANGVAIWHAGGDYSISWRALSWARNLLLKKSALMNLNTHMREEAHRYPDIDQELLLAQLKNQEKILTKHQIRILTGTLPLSKNPKVYLDPVLP